MIQVVNYALPLILVPYLLWVIGPTQYGLAAFDQSLVNYLVILMDCVLSATRRISVERDNVAAVSRMTVNVWVPKACCVSWV